jgi:hypothetical protein
MASKAAFTIDELIPKLPKSQVITGSASLDGLLRLRAKGPSQSQLLAALERGINRASQRIAVDLKAALDAALRSNVWPTPSGPADIYETGELLASGSVTFDGTGITIAYDAPYAALVHYGGYINPYGNANSRVYLPPRPWVEAVLNGSGPVPRFDFASYYLQEIAAEING